MTWLCMSVVGTSSELFQSSKNRMAADSNHSCVEYPTSASHVHDAPEQGMGLVGSQALYGSPIIW